MASDLGLHCFPMSPSKDARLVLVRKLTRNSTANKKFGQEAFTDVQYVKVASHRNCDRIAKMLSERCFTPDKNI